MTEMEHPYDTPAEVGAEGGTAQDESSAPGWSARITRIVASQMRQWREERGLSAQQLADRTRELGYQVPRSVIANLENNRRDTVTVAEALILAAALDIPPTLLITAVGHTETVEILPGIEMSPWRARGWILGAQHPAYKSFSLGNWDQSRRAIVLYDIHRLLVNEHRQLQKRIRRLTAHDQLDVDDVERMSTLSRRRSALLHDVVHELGYSLSRLREHRRLIQSEGFLLPQLPPELAVMLRATETTGRHHLTDDDSEYDEADEPEADQMAHALLFDAVQAALLGKPRDRRDDKS